MPDNGFGRDSTFNSLRSFTSPVLSANKYKQRPDRTGVLSLQIHDRCPSCDKLQGIHNQIYACKKCNSKKGTSGLYSFYRKMNPKEKKFFDILPALLEKKYLKTVYSCHECAGDLDKTIANITTLELDFSV